MSMENNSAPWWREEVTGSLDKKQFNNCLKMHQINTQHADFTFFFISVTLLILNYVTKIEHTTPQLTYVFEP